MDANGTMTWSGSVVTNAMPQPGAPSHQINGGARLDVVSCTGRGLDTLVLNGHRDQYHITKAGAGYQTNDLDTNFSLLQVASNFIASPEFQRTYSAGTGSRPGLHARAGWPPRR